MKHLFLFETKWYLMKHLFLFKTKWYLEIFTGI